MKDSEEKQGSLELLLFSESSIDLSCTPIPGIVIPQEEREDDSCGSMIRNLGRDSEQLPSG